MQDDSRHPFDQPVEIPIDGTLDLHAFAPGDVPLLIEDYLEACLEKGIHSVTIVHGKGSGVLRERVHGLLRKHPRVIRFELDRERGNWGMTRVVLG